MRRSKEADPEEKKDPNEAIPFLPATIMPLPGEGGSSWDEPVDDNLIDDDDDDDDDEYPPGVTSEDPYIYSDDSASLSDAYFYPTDDDLARPPRYREQDPLQYTLANYYGSVLRREQQQHHHHPHASPAHGASRPALWAASIQEDDVLPPDDGAVVASSASDQPPTSLMGGRKRRRAKRKEVQRMMRMKQQRQQMARERAVTQVRGKPQDPNEWRDYIFAIVFLIQLFAVIVCAGIYGFGYISIHSVSFPLDGRFHWQHHDRSLVELVDNAALGGTVYEDDTSTSNDSGTNSIAGSISAATASLFTLDSQNVITLVGITGFYACILTYISFGCMLILARALIHVMLVFSILVSMAWGVIGLTLDPYGVISIMGFLALLLTLGYTIFNWSRIPFAATNLYVALCGIRCTADITLLGLASLAVAFGWCIIWAMAFVGVVNTLHSLDCVPTKKDHTEETCDPYMELRHFPIYLLLLISLIWTNIVIRNTVRVIVASAIGTWWQRPQEIRPFCTPAVSRPLLQALTTSFGSICLGSLVINVAQTFTALGSCCCCLCGNNSDCSGGAANHEAKDMATGVDSAADSVELGRRCTNLGNCMGRFLRGCNRWSFTYIGLYNYSFHEAGERAIQLFETREWIDVVHDNLIQNVLFMATIVIGGSTGTFAVVVEETDGYYFSAFHMPTFLAFIIGSTLGYVISNILLLGVVGSAVNTILVCFASFPFEFDANHRRLSEELREAWSQQVWEQPV